MELSLEGPEPAAQPIAKPRNLDGGGAVRGGAPGRKNAYSGTCGACAKEEGP
jgi:hypothetical protein